MARLYLLGGVVSAWEAHVGNRRRFIPPLKEWAFAPIHCKRVLVIGDESRQVAYREIIGELGSEFDFVSGFAQPRAVEQRLPWADVVVLVTSYMSHKVSGVITASGKPIVWVNSAGERSFREAVEKYLIQDSAGP